MPAELWRVDRLAERLGCSRWRAWQIGREELAHARVQLGLRSLRWRADVVEAWIAAGGHASGMESHQPAGAA